MRPRSFDDNSSRSQRLVRAGLRSTSIGEPGNWLLGSRDYLVHFEMIRLYGTLTRS